jgi:hypothetical protein
LGLKKEGVLEGRVEGALKHEKKKWMIRIVEKSGRGREAPAPTLEELWKWKRIVAGNLTERWKNNHHQMDVEKDGVKRKWRSLRRERDEYRG